MAVLGRFLNRRCGVMVLLGLLFATYAQAQPIAYTVQVAALTDQASATSLRRTLTQAGYPAYLVSVSSESQTVYRLRVGSFPNRDAAEEYAAAMRGIGGTVPVPALAEGTPPDLIPLEPKLLLSLPLRAGDGVQVLAWNRDYALRQQSFEGGRPRVAQYRILTKKLLKKPFEAWRSSPLPQEANEVARVTNLPLKNQQALEDASKALGLSATQIASYRFTSPSGERYLIVAEHYDPLTHSGGRYPALGNPGVGHFDALGPSDLTWFGQQPRGEFAVSQEQALFDLRSLKQRGKLQLKNGYKVAGKSWQAEKDGVFTTLTQGDRRWRALIGAPLWAGGQYLLTYQDKQLFLFEIL